MPKSNLGELHLYLGVDPGQAGGFVAIYSTGEIFYCPAPETERDIWQWFDRQNVVTSCHAVIEQVHSMPKQGVASSFKFGMNYGLVRMALIASKTPFEQVTPQKWQKALGITPCKKEESKSQFKTRLLSIAQQLYPQLPIWKEPRSKGKQLSVCDALLLARYCQLKCEGKLNG